MFTVMLQVTPTLRQLCRALRQQSSWLLGMYMLGIGLSMYDGTENESLRFP